MFYICCIKITNLKKFIMDEQELLQEVFNYLNAFGNYREFLDYMEQRGFDLEELESDIERFEL